MLATYRSATQRLLQNPPAPTSLYATADIDAWINMARGQLAGEGECIRSIGTISTVAGQRAYNFSSISFGSSATTGIQGAININTIQISIASGQHWLTPRSWPWFQLYHLNNVVPTNAIPSDWSQYGQGAAPPAAGPSFGGSFYLDPPPDDVYVLNCDCVCYPIPLTDDTTVEAIPYLWTDAVPFFATYYALLSSQTSARQADAERMYNHYETFVERARRASNPSVGRYMYAQTQDPTTMAKLGQQKGAA